ncbi:MAG: hypothetical protein PSX36_07365, partial [bacterium]|nr:hypothetical protein [bacterium]
MRARIFTYFFLFILIQRGITQNDPAGERPTGTYTLVTDTLHYYFNKYYFKTGTVNLKNFPGYKSPAATSTAITHVGSLFENADTLVITGLEGYAFRYGMGITYLPVHLYLCALDPISGMPLLPGIDSLVLGVGGSSSSGPILIGGNFTVPRTLLGNFALLFRNMSRVSGDTVQLMRTACKTSTNTGALVSEKFSDGYGFVRYNANFYSATNFTATGFG